MTKRSGVREPFDRAKVIQGLRAATKNRPVDDGALDRLAREVEDLVRDAAPTATTQLIGVAVLERLRAVDDVSYLRFASVYKGFADADDFQREVGLLTKETAPKRPAP